MAITILPLYYFCRDPLVRAAFERAERDNGAAFAVSAQPKPVLIGGAAKTLDAA